MIYVDRNENSNYVNEKVENEEPLTLINAKNKEYFS